MRNQVTNEEGEQTKEYTESYIIGSTKKEDKQAEEGAKEVLSEDYNATSSNCAQCVQSALRNAGKKDGSSFTPIPSIAATVIKNVYDNLVPNKIYKNIKKQNKGTVVN